MLITSSVTSEDTHLQSLLQNGEVRRRSYWSVSPNKTVPEPSFLDRFSMSLVRNGGVNMSEVGVIGREDGA